MPRDWKHSATTPSLEALANPLVDFYPLESQFHLFEKCKIAIQDADVLSRIQTLQQARTHYNLGQRDLPVTVALRDYEQNVGKRMSYDASSFYIHANNYYRAATAAPLAISPVLYYYGFMFLMSSLTRMVFAIRNPTQSHGLAIRWPQGFPSGNRGLSDASIDHFLENVSVCISPHGAFARFRDTFSVLGYPGVFGLIDGNGIHQNPIVTNTNRTLSLREICDFNYTASGYPQNAVTIPTSELLFDFLVLFITGSIARYRPTIWRVITSGKGALLADTLGTFRRLNEYPMFLFSVLDELNIVDMP